MILADPLVLLVLAALLYLALAGAGWALVARRKDRPARPRSWPPGHYRRPITRGEPPVTSLYPYLQLKTTDRNGVDATSVFAGETRHEDAARHARYWAAQGVPVVQLTDQDGTAVEYREDPPAPRVTPG